MSRTPNVSKFIRPQSQFRIFCLLTVLLFLTFIGFCFPFVVYADENDDAEEIGEIVVEADAQDNTTIRDKPTSSGTIIPLRDKLDRYVDLKDILMGETGIHTREFSGRGHASTVNIRGVSAKGVLILIDGVPLNGLWSIGVNLSGLPLSGFDIVEVHKGGGGAYYGDAALGGTINLVTGESQNLKNNVTFSAGSFNLIEAKALINHLSPDGDLLIGLTGSSSLGDFSFLNDNGTSLDTSDDFNDTRENNETDTFGCLVKFTKEISPGSRYSLVSEIYRSRSGIPGLVTFPSPNARQIDRRIFLQAQMEKDNVWSNTDAAVRFFFRRNGIDYEDKLGEATGSPVDTRRWDDLVGTSLKFDRYDSDGDGLWTGSSEFATERFNQSDGVERTRSKVALSLQREMYSHDGRFTTQIASRFDAIEGFNTRMSFRAGGAFEQTEKFEWRANIGNSFRVPGFDELYENRGLIVGNPDLVPEKGFDFDLGFIHRDKTSSLGVTFFRNELTDQVIYELTSGHRFKPFNVGKSDMTGVEFSFRKDIGDIAIISNYTWLDARNRSDDPASKNKKLPSRPEHEVFIQLASKTKPFGVECDYHYASGNFITFANTTKLDARSRVDMRLKWQQDDWSITGEIRNLLNRNLTDIRGFPLPKRSFYLTFSHDL